MKSIVEKIGAAAMLEQFAEECLEAGHAALKLARIMRKENPTPVTAITAWRNLIEEYTDLRLCAREINIHPDKETARYKLKRWRKRLKKR